MAKYSTFIIIINYICVWSLFGAHHNVFLLIKLYNIVEMQKTDLINYCVLFVKTDCM